MVWKKMRVLHRSRLSLNDCGILNNKGRPWWNHVENDKE
jgi:hypothetical protein